MGWLTDITNWFRDAIKDVWQAIVDFFNDLILFGLDGILSLAAVAINAIPAPSFLQSYSIGSIVGAAGPTVGWIVVNFRIAESLSIIAAAYAFRLTRKLFTLFQW